MSAKPAITGNKHLTMAEQADIHELYEESVQNVEHEVEFMQTTFKEIRDRTAYLFREDFVAPLVCLVSGYARVKNSRLSASILIRSFSNGAARIV